MRREFKKKQKERREKKNVSSLNEYCFWIRVEKEETDGLVEFEKKEHTKYDRQARKVFLMIPYTNQILFNWEKVATHEQGRWRGVSKNLRKQRH